MLYLSMARKTTKKFAILQSILNYIITNFKKRELYRIESNSEENFPICHVTAVIIKCDGTHLLHSNHTNEKISISSNIYMYIAALEFGTSHYNFVLIKNIRLIIKFLKKKN